MAEYSEEEHVAAEIARLERVAADEWAEPGDDEIEVGLPGPQDELVDLGALWDEIEASGWAGEEPIFGQVPDYDHRLFYRGLNGLAGDSSSAKSLTSQLLIVQGLREGRVEVVFDVETGRRPKGYLHRLMMLGATRKHFTENLVYVNWRSGVFPMEHVLQGLRGRAADFVVVDSVPEAMSAAGANENSASDVIRWNSLLSDGLLLSCGPDAVVLLIDGLPKGFVPGRDVRGGVGSGRKLYAAESYWRMYARNPKGSKTIDGYSELVCTKDRWGVHQEGATVADVFYGPSGFGLRQHVSKSGVDPEKVRAAVLEFIEASGAPGLGNPTGGEIKAKCGTGYDVALDVLLDNGEVRMHEPPGRPGRPAYRYYAAKFELDPEE